MSFNLHCALVPVSFVVIAIFGCDHRMTIEPTRATRETYRDLIELDDLPAETRILYDATVEGELAGSNVDALQNLLDSAQRIEHRKSSTIYLFQLNNFGMPFEKVYTEGVPFLYISVQNEYGIIYKCDIGVPEY